MTEQSPAEALFFAALALPPAERAALLAAADPGLRARVEKLLAAAPQVGDFLEADAATAAFDPPTDGPTADYPGRDEHLGATLAGKYKLVEEIGEGGMGSVFLAQQTEPVRRAVAVKVIKAGMDSKAVLARFEAERQALALMDHPNIARVLDAGATEAGRPFFVMELVKGVPITEYCDAHRLTTRQRLELFVPVCQAIQHAHQKGVIHRDIKPSNVLVALYDDRPVPKVIDFGVAKAAGQSLTDKTLMTGFGAVVGTPEYMSPEQASLNNLDVDTRSDVYSLGVLLYELLTGSTPVDRKSLGQAALLEVLRIVREVEAPKPSAKLSTLDTLPSVAANRGTEPAKLSKLMRGELDWLVLKALEKDRIRRYDTANGLARDVQRYLADEVVEARPPSAGYRVRKFVRRHTGQVLAASLVLLALVAGVVGTTVGLIEARKQERIAVSAQTAEAERANGERQAKEQAEAAKTKAEAEKDRAVKAEADSEAVLRFVVDRVIAAAFPVGVGTGLGKDVTLRQALESAERRIGEDFAQVPRAEVSLRRTLGHTYSSLDDKSRAAIQYSFALDVARQKLGVADPLVVSVEGDIALLLNDTNKRDQACGLLEEVLARLERRTPRDEESIRDVVGMLSGFYQKSNMFDKARRTAERATAKAIPPQYKRLEEIFRDGDVHFNQKRWSQAADAYLRGLDEMRADWRPEDTRVRYAIAQLVTNTLRLAGRFPEAMSFGHRLYTECHADFGPYDSLTEKLAWTLITIYTEDSVPPSVGHAAFIRDRLGEKTEKYGPGHQQLSPDVINLSHMYGSLDRHADAIALLESYTAAVPESKRAELSNYEIVVENLSHSYVKVGRRREAAGVLTAHVARLQRVGLGDSRRQRIVYRMADSLEELGEWSAAVRACENVLTERRKIDPPDWRVFSARSSLGASLTGAKRYAEAETELLAGYHGLTDPASRPTDGARPDLPRLAVDNLLRLYTAWGKPDEVKKWRAERAKYPPELAPPPKAVK